MTRIAVAAPRLATRWAPLRRLMAWLQVRRDRVTLADLDDALLRDIGITRAQAMSEARRPFWDLPETYDGSGDRR